VKPTFVAMLCVVAGVLSAGVSGCSLDEYSCAAGGQVDDGPRTREEALECAPETYRISVTQGYDGPCIYDGGPDVWRVIVDATGERTFREAMKLCGYGPSAHAVVLDRDGNVRFAR
jgi:hypothetical protein